MSAFSHIFDATDASLLTVIHQLPEDVDFSVSVEEVAHYWNLMPLCPFLNSLTLALGIPILRENGQESTTFVAHLTRIDANSLGPEETDRQCPVCRERYADPSENSPKTIFNEAPVRTPCGHIIGQDCLENWVSIASSCQICRAQLTGSGFSTNDNGSDGDTDDGNNAMDEELLLYLLSAGKEYLETNPFDQTFGGFKAWATAEPSGMDPDEDATRAACACILDHFEDEAVVTMEFAVSPRTPS